MAAAPQLLEALNVLYYHEDPHLKERASAWLDTWQQAQEAWSVSDSVLHDGQASLEAQYFCAQTLRTKVQRDFEELPDAAVASLRESLITLLIKFSRGAPPVRTQLCLALAAMAVHLPAVRWEDVPPGGAPAATGDIVRWFAIRFQSVPPDRALPCMLEMLTVLPQEAYSHKVAVRPERRRQFGDELKASTPVAFEVLSSCLAQQEDRTRQQVLEAFGAWLRLSEGQPFKAVTTDASQSPLIAAALDGLRSNETFHAAVDAVCELIWATLDLHTQQQHPSMTSVIQAIVPAVMSLRPRFAVASHRLAAAMPESTPGARVERSVGNGGATATDDFDDDEDVAKGMARLFCELAEAYLSLIATAVAEVQAPVEAMLEVAAFPDFSVCSMSFNFWARLAKTLVQSCVPAPPESPARDGRDSPDVGMPFVPPVEALRRRAAFAPTFERLVALLRDRTRYANNHEAMWSREDRADFKRVRHEVSDALEDCAVLLGYRGALMLLAQPLVAAAAASQSSGAWDWRAAEASLYCVRAISKCGAEPGLPELQQLLRALPQLTGSEPRLLYTSCTVVAAYAPWLGVSLQGGLCQEVPSELLHMVIAGLARTDAAGAAASALVALCEQCSSPPGANGGMPISAGVSPLRSSLDELGSLYVRATSAGVVERGGGGSGGGGGAPSSSGLSVNEEDVLLIMQAVCTATFRSLPRDQMRVATGQLLMPVLTAVQAAAAALPAAPAAVPMTNASRDNNQLSKQFPLVSPLLDRLTVVFDYLKDEQLAADILSQSWPVLDMVLSRCGADARLVEHACRALRHGIKAAGRLAAPVVPMLLEVLPGKYRQTRQSVFLYVTGELAKLFGDQPAHSVALSQVLCGLLAEACTTLDSLPALTEHPDLVDDVFLCAARAINYCPNLLLASPQTLGTLLSTAMLGVLIQHREACTSTISFIVAVYDATLHQRVVPEAVQALQACLEQRTAMLIRLLLAGVAGAQPTMRLPDLAHSLSAILRSPLRAAACSWLAEALQLLPDAAVTQADKTQLMAMGAAIAGLAAPSRDENRRFCSAVDDFGELCRRNRRVTEMAQRALLPQALHDQVLKDAAAA